MDGSERDETRREASGEQLIDSTNGGRETGDAGSHVSDACAKLALPRPSLESLFPRKDARRVRRDEDLPSFPLPFIHAFAWRDAARAAAAMIEQVSE